ncbi:MULTISPECIES: 3-hydroxyacyl-CoA dehydrogenase [unclassified Halomonas]|uniref:3-hydroxyacyl-CoA dehydrogenase n=1 Tax=unclassified Halomonas TaxID=2609666 RepID=UPI000C96C61C|nr:MULTISPECIES: 3-hydroxyacyl-CoA dehydrogenase [unclassified Halomonas]MAR71927.1 3-hydroxybutyryl-CoA dehydrogenase [Halomonas sp.]MBR9881547.1 3-hydroxyacyl-CoA dehydrogenase [Gammaproteobacteria bacterium]
MTPSLSSSLENGPHRLCVLGGGVLGGQIAWHSAFKGKSVIVYDIDDTALERCRASHDHYAGIYQADVGAKPEAIAATRARLAYTSDLAEAVADAELVIEAVPEDPEIKRQLYRTLSPLLGPETLMATNSSTLLPADFADDSGRPERYCALHFANLLWIMNVAEVMAHPRTSLTTLESVTRFAIDIGMIPIPVEKPRNGYLINSWLVPLLTASLTLLREGVGSAEMIDRTFMKMWSSAAGPCGMMDIIGMKTCFDVSHHWGEVNDNDEMRANADFLHQHFLASGKLGLPSGEGFYRYPAPAYSQSTFMAVPDHSEAGHIAAQVLKGMAG